MHEKVRKRVKEVFLKYRLEPAEPVDQFFVDTKEKNKRYYSTLCQGKDGNQYFFKISVIGDQDGKKAMENEINFFLKTKENSVITDFTPSFIDYETGDFSWYLRQSVDGKIIGNPYEIISDVDESLVDKITKIAMLKMEEIRKLNGTEFEIMSNKKYLDQISKAVPELEKYYDRFWLIMQSLFSDTDDISGKKLIMSHGDFHFGNFIYSAPRLFIIDWGHVHYGNIAEDFAKLWVSLWQFPMTQQTVLKNFVKENEKNKVETEKNIRLMLFLQASDSFRHWSKHKDLEDLEYKEGFEYFNRLIEKLLKDNFSIIELNR